MLKQIINGICYSDKDVMLTSSNGTTVFIRRNDNKKDKKMYLEDFFNERDAFGLLGVTIRVFENPDERICTLFIDRDDDIVFADKETTEDALKKAADDKIKKIPEIADEFNNIFEINFKERFDATEIETIREVVELVSKPKQIIFVITNSIEEDSHRIAIIDDGDAEEVRQAIIYDLFEEYTKCELENDIYVTIEVYDGEDKKECHLAVSDKRIVLIDKERIKDEHIEDFKEINPDETPEENKDLMNYINNCVNDFENVFGKIKNRKLVEKDLYEKNNEVTHRVMNSSIDE